MQIRPLNDLDIPALLAIEHLSQAHPWSEAAFQRCREANYPGWVIDQEKNILGYLILSLSAGECHILNLCIHPESQRQGHGSRLLIYALEWARKQGAGIAYLEVRRSNLNAIDLYRKMNFKCIGERKNYYPPVADHQEDALVFARDLGME